MTKNTVNNVQKRAYYKIHNEILPCKIMQEYEYV